MFRRNQYAISLARHFTRVIQRNRGLIRELVLRDIKKNHAGHTLGSLWVYMQPLIVVITYMMVFGIVIGSRMTASKSFPGDYTSYILAGVTPWLVTANALGRSTNAFSGNANLVKQVVFPIEILPIATIAACFISFAPTFLIIIGYKATAGGGISLLSLALPVVLGIHALLCIGLTLTLSSISPFFRDVTELVAVYTSVSLYFAPAVYLPEWIPPMIRPLLYLNPFSYIVWVYQDTLFFGEFQHPVAWLVFGLMALFLSVAGLVVFSRIKPYLGNVL